MDFENIFDEALTGADNVILDTMGVKVSACILGAWIPIRAVFDDPQADTALQGGAARFDDVAPTLFLKTVEVCGLKKQDPICIAAVMYWVTHIGNDDTGTCVVTLARGEPGKPTASPVSWSRQ